MNLGGDIEMGLLAVAVVAVLLLGAVLEAWIDFREDVSALREQEERRKAAEAAEKESGEESGDDPLEGVEFK